MPLRQPVICPLVLVTIGIPLFVNLTVPSPAKPELRGQATGMVANRIKSFGQRTEDGEILIKSELTVGARGAARGLVKPQAPVKVIKPVGIDHVALLATDIEHYVAFYRDFLGFPEMQRGNEVPGGPNVYYWRDGSAENLAKEKQGRLFMIKVWVGNYQALEFFPTGNPIPERKNLHHLGIGFEDEEAVRKALLAVGAQAPKDPGTGLFFTYDKNISGTEVIPAKPRKSTETIPKTETPADKAISTHLLFAELPGENSMDLTRFYVETLGYRRHSDGTPGAEIRLDIGFSGDHVLLPSQQFQRPRIGFEVKSLEAARQFLERSPWRSNYKKTIQIVVKDGRRCIELEDPEGVRVVLLEGA